MKEVNGLELRADRREFTLAALLAMLGGVSITISGCGSASSPSAPSAAPPVADKTGSISSNHGHVAVITSGQFASGNALSLSLQGTSGHGHTLELSAGELAQIADGRTLSKECSGTSHTHLVTFN
jgi:hypothetical protein